MYTWQSPLPLIGLDARTGPVEKSELLLSMTAQALTFITNQHYVGDHETFIHFPIKAYT